MGLAGEGGMLIAAVVLAARFGLCDEDCRQDHAHPITARATCQRDGRMRGTCDERDMRARRASQVSRPNKTGQVNARAKRSSHTTGARIAAV